MVESAEVESKIRELIEKLVGDHWERSQSVCYLSMIGLYLNTQISGYRSALPMGLREFLRRNPIVQVVEFPGVDMKVGAVPLSVSLPDDVRELFSQDSESRMLRTPRTAYVEDFWHAFFRPIEGHSRYVVLDDLERVTVHENPPDGQSGVVYEIRPQDLSTSLPNEPIANKIDATHSAIDRWIKRHSLEPRLFARTRRRTRDSVVGRRLASLISAFRGLPEEDLSRISIPMDVLIKLNSRDDD